MKTLHTIQPTIPENLLNMAAGLCFHFQGDSLSLGIVDNRLLYSFSGPPHARLTDTAYWASEGRRAPEAARERAEALLRGSA